MRAALDGHLDGVALAGEPPLAGHATDLVALTFPASQMTTGFEGLRDFNGQFARQVIVATARMPEFPRRGS